MGKESIIWQEFYKSINKIITTFDFTGRKFRPPKDELNALISFGNSLLYGTILTEIYNTYLDPTISYLHEPLERRFSLTLDLAEIFKPIIVAKTIFKLVNKKIITKNDFRKEVGYYLNTEGKKKFIKEYEELLSKTVKHPTLKRNVTIRYLIRLEAYKLLKHILGDKEYKSLRAWW